MASTAAKAAHRTNGGDLRKSQSGRADVSENSLDALRSQYLAEVFGLPADTALTIAELAFGGDHHA